MQQMFRVQGAGFTAEHFVSVGCALHADAINHTLCKIGALQAWAAVYCRPCHQGPNSLRCRVYRSTRGPAPLICQRVPRLPPQHPPQAREEVGPLNALRVAHERLLPMVIPAGHAQKRLVLHIRKEIHIW